MNIANNINSIDGVSIKSIRGRILKDPVGMLVHLDTHVSIKSIRGRILKAGAIRIFGPLELEFQSSRSEGGY